MEKIIKEYLSLVRGISAVYYDSCHGFSLVSKFIEVNQQQLSFQSKQSIEALDELEVIYGKGDPNFENSEQFFSIKYGEVKKRNKKDGVNRQVIGSLCIVLIYQYWEDHYRDNIARVLAIQKNELNLDIMGDIRLIRRSIIHNKGIAIEEIKNCKIVHFFKAGETINITNNIFEKIVKEIIQGLQLLSSINKK